MQGKIIRTAGAGQSPLRACSSRDCYGLDKIKTKYAQLVTAPYIVPEPLITGTTSIFKVSGELAQVADVRPKTEASGGPPPIYRIKPGTHAHVVNYVFVAEDSDLMKKIRSKDPAVDIERLESQRECAITQLQNLTSKHRGKVQQTYVQSSPAPPRARVDSSIATPTPKVDSLARLQADIHQLQRRVADLKKKSSR
ncbi:uncharacterized protein LOC119560234 [Drosophila subpulchrella]|uniref:uncharacterized protein LOC119560234 n=1 Tax=Drosophila subpulchrella TaxID=1486046 RepID=UPI0018A1664E|nr:uncharacterized protein LOC119560234 [Drosophila subpulchrella]